jgi:hypothetical protein
MKEENGGGIDAIIIDDRHRKKILTMKRKQDTGKAKYVLSCYGRFYNPENYPKDEEEFGVRFLKRARD